MVKAMQSITHMEPLYSGVGAGNAGGTVLHVLHSKSLDVKTEQSNLWPEPRATLCPKTLFAKIITKQLLRPLADDCSAEN